MRGKDGGRYPYKYLATPTRYDLLLIDITMPKMNGFELYEKIEKIDNKVKVCFMSAYVAKVNHEALREKLPMLTMDDNFIKKPIEIHDLVKRVKTELLLLLL